MLTYRGPRSSNRVFSCVQTGPNAAAHWPLSVGLAGIVKEIGFNPCRSLGSSKSISLGVTITVRSRPRHSEVAIRNIGGLKQVQSQFVDGRWPLANFFANPRKGSTQRHSPVCWHCKSKRSATASRRRFISLWLSVRMLPTVKRWSPISGRTYPRLSGLGIDPL
jgi:hypothetical protein